MNTGERQSVDIEGWVELSKQKFPDEYWKQAQCIEYFVDKITKYNSDDIKRFNLDRGVFHCSGTIFYSGGNVHLWWKLSEKGGTDTALGLESLNATDKSLRILFCTDPSQTEPYMFPLVYEHNL